MEFNFETMRLDREPTVKELLQWIQDLHSQLTDNGILPDGVDSETHNQIMILSNEADAS